MSAEDKDKATLLLRDVPGDVVRELDARAETNYRSRSGEVLAILTAVCRGQVALPVSLDYATIAAMKPADDLEEDGLRVPPFKPEPLEPAAVVGPDSSQELVGGDV